MKALTVLQPWASLIACGAKTIETRSWATKYRGPIAIHAGLSNKYDSVCFEEPFLTELKPFCFYSKDGNVSGMNLPCGEVIAIADLVDCVQITGRTLVEGVPVAAQLANKREITGNELEFGDYTPGRYAWILENVRQIEPVPVKGKQGLWNWEGHP